MSAIAHPSLTNSQQLGVLPWLGGRKGPLARFAATLRLWRRRVHERQVLASPPTASWRISAPRAPMCIASGHAVLACAAAVLGW